MVSEPERDRTAVDRPLQEINKRDSALAIPLSFLFLRVLFERGAGENFFAKKFSPAIFYKNQSILSITQAPPREISMRVQLPVISLETAH